MSWLTWILFAFLMMGAELFVPTGFVLLLIGLSFFFTGIFVSLGFHGPTWAPWAVCLTLLITFISLLRKPLVKKFGFDAPSNYEDFTGSEVIINEDIAPGAVGDGELRGAHWSIRNVGSTLLGKGERCRVLRMDGLTVEVKK
jgi:membrane protein implicated in regulation of membrane protease activity